jgi:hypothetical protein
MNGRLRKIDYLDYLKCPQEYWLERQQPLLIGIEPDTLESRHLRQQGYDVESYAKQLERFRSDETRSVEFQRSFQTADMLVRCDVTVTSRDTGVMDIYEIKAAAHVKEEHYDDVAFQRLVAEAAGATVGRCFVVTMNGDYVRQGDIDASRLFDVNDITEQVNERMDVTRRQAREAIEYLDTVPVASLLDYCKENKLDCTFIRANFPDLPEYTIFDISFLKTEKRRELLARNIVDICDVPDDFPLSDKQRRQVDAAKSGKVIVDHDGIRKRMDAWQYPLQFLDYETFWYAIPQFDGLRPFQQMCFQYSLHTIDAPGAEPRHSEYLARRGEENPPLALLEHMKEAFGANIGTVFVWYENFEKTRNSEMAEMFPEHADFLNEVNAHMCDLMKIFADRLYIHPDFKGRSSIKKVLPVLCSHLSYEALGIGEGMTASISWFHAVKRNIDDAERERIYQDLLEYCGMDTWAMIEIYRVLEGLF